MDSDCRKLHKVHSYCLTSDRMGKIPQIPPVLCHTQGVTLRSRRYIKKQEHLNIVSLDCCYELVLQSQWGFVFILVFPSAPQIDSTDLKQNFEVNSVAQKDDQVFCLHSFSIGHLIVLFLIRETIWLEYSYQMWALQFYLSLLSLQNFSAAHLN